MFSGWALVQKKEGKLLREEQDWREDGRELWTNSPAQPHSWKAAFHVNENFLRTFYLHSPCPSPFPIWLTTTRFFCNILLFSHWSLEGSAQTEESQEQKCVHLRNSPDAVTGFVLTGSEIATFAKRQTSLRGNTSVWAKILMRGTRVGC